MAFPVTINGRTYTEKDFAGLAYVKGLPDLMEDFATHAANVHSATSTSELTVGPGPKSFTIEPGKPWKAGANLRISRASDPVSTWMDAIVTAYNELTGVMAVTVTAFAGSGTFTDWTVNVGGGGAIVAANPVPITQGGTGATTAGAARASLGAVGGPFGTNTTEVNRLVLWNASDGTLVKNGPSLGQAGTVLVSNGPGNPPSFQSVVTAVTGEIRLWPTAAPPAGWLLCQGQAVSRATFSTLFGVIGTTFGAGDGVSTFNLPDFRGRTPIGAGQGPGLTNRTLGQIGGAETHALSEAETPVKSHTHSFSGTTGIQSANHSHSFSGNTGTESQLHTHTTPYINEFAQMPFGGGINADAHNLDAISPHSGQKPLTSFNHELHTHPFAGTTGTNSANHTHSFSGTTGATSNSSANAHNNMMPWLCVNFMIKT